MLGGRRRREDASNLSTSCRGGDYYYVPPGRHLRSTSLVGTPVTLVAEDGLDVFIRSSLAFDEFILLVASFENNPRMIWGDFKRIFIIQDSLRKSGRDRDLHDKTGEDGPVSRVRRTTIIRSCDVSR